MPNRILYSSLLTSTKVNQLKGQEFELYVRLLLVVDDYGRYSGLPTRVARSCWPDREDITSKTVSPMLSKLAAVGLITAYTVDGEPYIEITNWKQRTRQTISRFPPPADNCQSIDGHMTVNCRSNDGHMTARDEDGDEDGDGDEDVIRETETERRVPYDQIVELWNRNVTSLPAVRSLTDARRRRIAALWRLARSDLTAIERAFVRVQDSDFLTGRTKTPWTGCGFDWVLTPMNWTKLSEGNYDNKKPISEAERIMSL